MSLFFEILFVVCKGFEPRKYFLVIQTINCAPQIFRCGLNYSFIIFLFSLLLISRREPASSS